MLEFKSDERYFSDNRQMICLDCVFPALLGLILPPLLMVNKTSHYETGYAIFISVIKYRDGLIYFYDFPARHLHRI
jgi:hypothetical protein